MPEWNPRANDIFVRAVEIDAPADRRLFLEQQCGGDAALQSQVESLLAAGGKIGSFLEKPAVPAPAPGGETAAYRPLTEGPGTVIGPYKLLQHIGEGGFGAVYMAEQEHPVRRKVALKIIKLGMDTREVIARFESERQALAMMEHPNIARVFDAGATESGRPYFVMELVRGVPITEFCDKNRFSAEQRLKLFVSVCNAIQHAHHKGIIHRDIKPSNVMVTLHDGVPVVKVIDFGVAKATAQKLTERTLFTAYGQMIGTPAYMSPEQAEMSGLDIDMRSDIFSLGVLLYELLTGTTPLDSLQLRKAGYAEMQRLIREEEAPRPSTRFSSMGGEATVLATNRGTDVKRLSQLLRSDLDWIVMKSLEKDRNRRYGSPATFAADVERYLNDEAVEACPPTLGYRLRKTYRRNRAALTTVAVVAAALVLGTAVSFWQALRAKEAERAAAAARDLAVNAEKMATEKSDEVTAAVGNLQVALNVQKNNQYAWDMQLISTAWETGQIEKIQQMLDRHTPDLRHFEWSYWNQLLHGERRLVSFGEQLAQNERPDSLSDWLLSESGTRAVTLRNVFDPDGPADSKAFEFHAKFYDTLENKSLGSRKLAARASFAGFAFQTPCLSFDGNRLAIGFPDRSSNPSRLKEIVVVDLASDKPIYQRSVESESVENLDLSPDGKYLLLECLYPFKAGTRGGMHLRVWDLNADKELWRTPIMRSRRMALGSGRSLYFNRDGSRIAMLKRESDKDTKGSSTVWETATGKELMSLPSTAKGPQCLVLSPDGQRLAVASGPDRSIAPGGGGQRSSEIEVALQVFDVGTQKELLSQTVPVGILGREAPAVQFNRDGSLVFLAANSRFSNVTTLFGWNLGTGKALADLNCRLSKDTIVFSPDGARFAALDRNTISIYNANTGIVFDTLRGHVGAISELAWSADGKIMYSIDYKGEFREWNIPTKSRNTIRGVTVSGENVNPLSPNGRFIVGFPGKENGRGSETSQPTMWDVENGQPHLLASRPVPAQAKPYSNYFAFSPNSRFVCLVRTTYDPLLRRIKADPEERTDFADMTVWDVDTRKEVGFLSLPEGAVSAEIVSDGHFAAILTNAKGLFGIEFPNGKQLWSRPDRGPAVPSNGIVRVSPDGRQILCSQGGISQPTGFNSKVSYWVLDAKTGEDMKSFDFDDRAIRHCAWSPDSRRIAFGNSTQSRLNPKSEVVVKIHDVSTGELLMQVLGDTLGAPRRTQSNCVAFSPDGRRIAVKTVDTQKPVDENSRIELYDSSKGNKYLTVTTGFAGPGQHPILAFSGDGHRIFDLKINRPGITSNGARVPGAALVNVINGYPHKERVRP